MAKSFRLEPELERQLEQAARMKGIPVSALIREAVADRCREILGQNLRTDLAEVIGTVSSEGGRGRRTGDAFRQILIVRDKR